MQNKWKKIIHSITKKGIVLLCAIKSHLDNAQINSLNSTYNPKFSFTHSHDHDHPRSKGITIVTNTLLTKCTPSNIHQIIPGCCKQANSELGLRVMLHFSVSTGVIQRKERGLAKWQLAAYEHWQPTMAYFTPGPLALAVWNNIKSILLAN